MNDEIKEILDYFQKDVDKYEESKKYLMQKYGYDEETIDNISQHERHINTKKLLDYITNLQQENERLKETNVYCNRTDCIGRIKDSRKYDSVYQEKEDYKSRCEKAIEYINENKHLSMFADCREPEEDWNYDLECSANDLLNILQNERNKR